MLTRVRIIASVSLCLALSVPAFGQGQTAPAALARLSLEELATIDVTSVSKQAEDVWHTPVAITVITQEDIRRSGATTLPEVLRLAPGVEVSRIDAAHWTVGIRGFGDQFSKSLLVLIDGRNIYTPLFAGTYWPAYDTLLADVDRIEVIRGPGGTIWGGNAVTGVINIITRPTRDTRGTLVQLSSGNLDHMLASARYGGGNPDGFSYRVFAKGTRRGPFFHTDGSDFDAWWMGQGGFRADWARGPQGTFSLFGEVSSGSHGQRVQISTLTPPGRVPTDGELDAQGANLVALWDRPLRGGGGVRLQAFYDRTVWRATHFEERRNTFDLDGTVQLAPIARHQLTIGAGARWSPGDFTPTVPTLDFQPRSFTSRLVSASVEDDISIVADRLSLIVGSKIEHNNYTGVELQPNARLLFTRGVQTVWGSVARAVRTPSRIEDALRSLTPAGPVPGVALPVFLEIAGNADIDVEQAVAFEAGYRQLFAGRVNVDVAVFHTEHDDLVSFARGPARLDGTPPARIIVNAPHVNAVSGWSRGLEIAPAWQVNDEWRVSGSYALRRFDFSAAPISAEANAVRRYEGSSPRHLVRAQAQWTRGAVEADVAYRHVSALVFHGIDGYHAADARVGWRVAPGFDLSAAVQNLFDPHHAEFPQTPAPVEVPRSLLVSMRWTLAPGR